MMTKKKLSLIGYASGMAGTDDSRTGEGPLVLQQSPFLMQTSVPLCWEAMVRLSDSNDRLRKDEMVRHLCEKLAAKSSELAREQTFFSVIGGDHSCAIGTWSGVYDALYEKGDIGLIWIDAHMDSHTPETSESGRIHGMPLACLLGYGHSTLTTILHDTPKLKPENVCLIGVHSFEQAEAELLKRLHVRVFFMDEVKQRGLREVMRESLHIVNRTTIGYGITLDLDSIDPQDAPGVDVPEEGGIHAKELFEGLSDMLSDNRLLGTEIAEFDPAKDNDHRTEKLIVSLLEMIAKSRGGHGR